MKPRCNGATMGTLYLVPTPLGNLEDITLRAQRVLSSVRLIACEDTRRTRQLLGLLGIEAPRLIAVHEHNEEGQIERLLARLAEEDIALVSDAGTPTISDPGFKLVRAAIEADQAVCPLPGPSAIITALSASGLPTDRFRFLGFPPSKGAARRRALEEVAGAGETLIFYVSPHQIEAFLKDAIAVFGATRRGVIARELTKLYETFHRGSLADLLADPGVARGELVVLIEGAPETAEAVDLDALMRRLFEEGYSPTRAAKEAVKRARCRRDEAYRVALALKREAGEAGEAEADEEA
ncbi:16S rRNA (cytidine(1402)-2'-O)-methyltransferase [Myxococcota bacterium]|nr:16S rRNA (cytidine(1402)-2'-O)-methyltransferase [Myxococcota bacterium]